MEANKTQYGTIDEYISQFPPEIQEKLEAVRKVLKESAPEAEERISYQMPAFFQNGVLVYFAALKNHIGFYPTAIGIVNFKEELSDYKTSKGAVQFPLSKPIPYELISRIVKSRIDENKLKAEGKQQKERQAKKE
jgi:Uncharacterized conserved protein